MDRANRRGYQTDVSDEEWAFVAPYLALCREDAAQRDYPLREVFNGLRYIVKTGNQWRLMPHDLPPWTAVYQQMRRWMDARCFEAMVEDLRKLLREYAGRKAQPTAMILDKRAFRVSRMPPSRAYVVERTFSGLRRSFPSPVATSHFATGFCLLSGFSSDLPLRRSFEAAPQLGKALCNSLRPRPNIVN